MLSFVYADQSPLSKQAVIASARTGDLIMYASAPTPASTPPLAKRNSKTANQRRREQPGDAMVPTIGQTLEKARSLSSLSCTSLLAMLMPAIAFSGGEREASCELDCVGVVVEKPNGDEASLLIYDVNRTLTLLPLSKVVNRPACMRPLLLVAADDGGNGATVTARRHALHKFLRTTIDDLCGDRLPPTTHERVMQSQLYLAAYLLFTAGVVGVPPHEFCAPRELRRGSADSGATVEYLFGAETLHLDQAMTRDYAYGNQIWLS